jgi:S1-C subfamily serine protease
MLHSVKDRKYAYGLLVVAATVLGIGLVLKPVEPEQKSAPSESEIAQLQRATQQRRLRDLSSYLTDAAESAAETLVFLPTQKQTGIIWDSRGPILTSARPPISNRDESTAVASDGSSIALTRRAMEPGVPFSAFSPTVLIQRMPAPEAKVLPDLGDWVLAVAKNAEGGVVFAHGLFQGIAESNCGAFPYRSIESSAPISAALAGGGLFSLDGHLLGLITNCEGQPIVIAAGTIREELRKPQSTNIQLQDYAGFRVADDNTDEHKGVASPGLLVVMVWAHSRGAEAGLRSGDLIMEADNKPLASGEDLAALINGENRDHTLKVRRRRRVMSMVLPAEAPDSKPSATPQGLLLQDGPSGREAIVAAVTPNSTAMRLGIVTGDVLLTVDGAPVSDASAGFRALQGSRTGQTLLTFARDGKHFEVLLTP